jgi:hypothetical protein
MPNQEKHAPAFLTLEGASISTDIALDYQIAHL